MDGGSHTDGSGSGVLGIGSDALARRADFAGFGEVDPGALAPVCDVLGPVWAEQVTASLDAAARAGGPAALAGAEARARLAAAEQRTFRCPPERGPIGDREQLGFLLHELGIPPRWHLAVVSRALCAVIPEVSGPVGPDDRVWAGALRALMSCMLVDLGVELEAYQEARREALAGGRTDTGGDAVGGLDMADPAAPTERRLPDDREVAAHARRIMHRVGLEGGALEGRRRLHAIDEAQEILAPHADLVREVAGIYEATFPAHAARFEELDFVTRAGGAGEALAGLQRDALLALVLGPWDERHATARVRMGLLVQHLGLAPHWFVGALGAFLGTLIDRLVASAMDRREATEVFCAAVRTVLADVALVYDAYVHAAEEPLVELRGVAEDVVASIPSGLAVLDEDLRIASANRAFGLAVGVPAPRAAGWPLLSVIPSTALCDRAREAVADGRPRQNVFVELPGGDEDRLLRVALTPLDSPEGHGPRRLLLLVDDVTGLTQLREAVADSRQRLRDLIEDVDAVVFEADPETRRFLYVSRRAERLLGHEAARWVGEDGFWEAVTHEDDRERLCAALQALAVGGEGAAGTTEYRMVSKAGRTVWVQQRVQHVAVREGDRTVLRGLLVDVTERRERQAELDTAHASLEQAHRRVVEERRKVAQAEKLSSIGLLAAGVAHEINNPLAGVLACVKSLRKGTVPAGRRDDYYEAVRDGLERIQATVQGLLEYARQRPPTPEPISPAGIVESCLRLVAPAMRDKRVRLESDVPAEAPELLADRPQVLQALINVVLNAVHAVAEGGLIRMALVEDDDRLGLCVEDEGPGIPDEILDRVCDPFFSTKPEGEGTGLGLAVTLGIARSNGGDLAIRSEQGAGTSVTLWLPRARSAVADAPVMTE